jgi:hypothetical protein
MDKPSAEDLPPTKKKKEEIMLDPISGEPHFISQNTYGTLSDDEDEDRNEEHIDDDVSSMAGDSNFGMSIGAPFRDVDQETTFIHQINKELLESQQNFSQIFHQAFTFDESTTTD